MMFEVSGERGVAHVEHLRHFGNIYPLFKIFKYIIQYLVDLGGILAFSRIPGDEFIRQ